jgi:AcrR family transcriptional regulator
LDAARELFSRQGFDGTTTREIAAAAEVNEAIIFRHFASKEELYWAVVSDQIDKRGRGDRLQRSLRPAASARDALAEVAETLLQRDPEDVALTRLLLFSALRNSELAEKFFRNYLAELLRLLSEYIREGVERGRLRPVDPEVGARALLGMVTYHNLIQELFGGERHQKYDPRQLGKQLADIWLNGVAARRNSPARRLPSHDSEGAAGGKQCGAARKPALASEQARIHAGTA